MRAPTTAVIFQISCNGGDFSRDRGNTRYIPPTDSGVTASAGWMDLIISVTNARINSSTAPRPQARESPAVRPTVVAVARLLSSLRWSQCVNTAEKMWPQPGAGHNFYKQQPLSPPRAFPLLLLSWKIFKASLQKYFERTKTKNEGKHKQLLLRMICLSPHPVMSG